ncbi:hypothetical protein ACHAWF_014030 [Thalassiosira exigua]
MFTGCFVVLIAFLGTASGCLLHGSESGICTIKYLPGSSDLEALENSKRVWEAELPFCGRWIASYYSPCVPAQPTKEWVAADANFPEGRLTSGQEDIHSIRKKDKWVEQTVTNAIQARIDLEKRQGTSHYSRNRDCQEAFSRFSCWLNFPRCGDDDESLPMCQSACENLFRVCGFASDLWRCEAEIVDGLEEYDLSTFFPGQPFARNEFHPKSNDPVAVCTPSIKGAAHSVQGHGNLIFTLLAFVQMALFT